MMSLSSRCTLLLICLFSLSLTAQRPITYYLPDDNYDENIPTPESFLGFQVGDWHITHDQQYFYLKALAEASDRVELVEYARSYEQRPLLYLRITSPKNQENIEAIKAEHVKLSDPDLSADMDTDKMPIVIYEGFNIHGNEPSGGNGATLVAYYLAASKSREVQKLLDESIILLDPCFNPDGFHRFSTWVNMHKNKNLTADPQDREYDESWPGSRTNHYWFDLNRDWLPTQHPESQGRIKAFHEWKPNILTDHHEMGSNSTFFFQPGVPTRTNPITPSKNQALTAKIGNYHAAALDEIGSLYFSKERYDDFYYGKGSTYPDVNACIGILFEQASSRGHLQETTNGLLSFPFTIRNQVTTALSTLEAGQALRTELLDFQKEFYQNAKKEAAADNIKGYIFTSPDDKGKLKEFLTIMDRHQIEVYKSTSKISANGMTFEVGDSYIVPTEQTQYRLIRGIFETTTTFRDSLFYDISSWTFPLSFNIEYAPLAKDNLSKNTLGAKISAATLEMNPNLPDVSDYAYVFEWDEYFAPKALYAIQSAGLRAKVATIPFTLKDQQFDVGTILVPVQNQAMTADEIQKLLADIATSSNVSIYDMDTGLSPEGIDLGSGYFSTVEIPKILLVVGEGVTSYDAGEVWHLLDQRYDIPITMVQTDNFRRIDLARYNKIVMVSGSYYNLSASSVEKLKSWVAKGGTIVAMKNAVSWLKSKGLANVEFERVTNSKEGQRPYAKRAADSGSRVIGGAIFESKIDLSHPLFYGYNEEILPVFRRGTLFFKPAKNPYATPALYTDDPLLSGYIKDELIPVIKNTATVVVSGTGSGKVICFADNPNFRAFWYGTNKLFANAIFFGNIISGSAVQR